MKNGYDGILTPEQIKAILTISEQGSFGRAASVLGVAQPAITQQVRRLEKKFGRALFNRAADGVKLTLDGEAIVVFARAMLAISDDMVRHFRSSPDWPALRIGFNEDFGRTVLPAVLGLFIREYPSFRIETVCGDGDLLFQALDDQKLDLVIARHHDSVSRGHLLWTERTVWIGRPDMQLPLPDPLPLVLPPASKLRTAVLTALQNHSRNWRVLFESGSLATVEAAMRAGLGVGAFPSNMEWIDLVQLDATAGLPELPDARFVFEQRRPPHSAAADVFSQVLQEAARLSFGIEPES